MNVFLPDAGATLVGSMPHGDREEVIGLILRTFPEIPVWPQLPVYPREQMMVQYLEGLPGLREAEGKLFVETSGEESEAEVLAFYEDYLAAEAGALPLEGSRFAFGPETGRTFYAFLDAARRAAGGLRAVKGQVTGPFTQLLGLKDREGRAVLYNEPMRDVVAKHLAMKARWQAERLGSLGCPVILFMDEPALAGYGSSAFVSVSREMVLGLLSDVSAGARSGGALVGVHVCANTDWSLVFDASLDVVNLDAYGFMDRFALYQKGFARHIARGGIIAWGLVPTSDPELISRETPASLAGRWFREIEAFVSEGAPLSRILSQSLFTPSCGCGTLSRANAERVAEVTRGVGEIMRERLGGVSGAGCLAVH